MKKILVSNIMMLKDTARFERELNAKGLEAVFPKVNQYMNEAELLPIVSEFDGWLAGDDQITEAVLKAALPRLKVISKWGTGTDSIDKEAAKRLGVPVFNSPGAFRDAVAEVAIGYMLSLARDIHLIDRQVRSGQWPKPMGPGLVGKTLGIIGFGAIGKGIAERALAMKMNVQFSDPFAANDSLVEVKKCESLEQLLATSDYVCLACNLSKENIHLINKDTIAQMKPGAKLVNVARGPLVNEADLIEALKSGYLSGAGLDVFEVEPLPTSSPLAAMDNVILGSHNANNMEAATEYVHGNTLKNLYLGLGIE